MKLPERHHDDTLRFYRDTLGFETVETGSGAKVDFDAVTLWLDRVLRQSQTDIWLELEVEDTGVARTRLESHGVEVCDEVEPLPEKFDGFWIAAPAGTVHLVSGPQSKET